MKNVPKTGDNGQPTVETDPVNRIPPSPAAPDPFNPNSLRLSQDFGSSIGVKKILTRVPIGKPHKHVFFRVRPGEEWRLQTATLEAKGATVGKDVYLVAPSLWSELPGEILPTCLFLFITRQNDIGLWDCRLPDESGRRCLWHDSALDAAKIAETRWVRIVANMNAGRNDIFEAAGELSEPTWPELSFRDILELGFKDRFITTLDHPVLRSLRGEV